MGHVVLKLLADLKYEVLCWNYLSLILHPLVHLVVEGGKRIVLV